MIYTSRLQALTGGVCSCVFKMTREGFPAKNLVKIRLFLRHFKEWGSGAQPQATLGSTPREIMTIKNSEKLVTTDLVPMSLLLC